MRRLDCCTVTSAVLLAFGSLKARESVKQGEHSKQWLKSTLKIKMQFITYAKGVLQLIKTLFKLVHS